MKKIFAANWISAARAVAPASNTAGASVLKGIRGAAIEGYGIECGRN